MLKDKINEQLLLSAIESVAGADVAHAVEIGLQVAELTEAADQLPADQVLTRAERLKLRKKHKIEVEQSL